MNTSQVLDDNPPCDLFGSKGIAKEKKRIDSHECCDEQVQKIETKGFN